MLVVKAVLNTEGPLSIAMPVPEGGRANKWGQFPVMTRGVDEDGNKLQTGYLPASTLRGYLRRAAVLPDMQAAAEAGSPYRLPKAYAELIGQDAASEQASGDIDLVALQAQRASSPILDLFGSGLGIKSRLRVSHFLPSVNVLPDVFSGTRKDLDDSEQAFNLLNEADRESFANRSESNNKRAEASKLVKTLKARLKKSEKAGDDIAEIKTQIEAAERLQEKYEALMGDMQNSSRTILEHHALPAGLELHGKLVIERDTDRDIELLLRGLDALSLDPKLGAQAARGCGEISGTFDFYRNGLLFKRVSVGSYEPAKVTDFDIAEGAAQFF
ncbi:RAMP superfamily CRISPR-associated protein [Congregibacter variabilis]|uniref:RAMP superfamily CRISPR-associated protein n=1 Tax=Congregibacter variabilis TaxID=3081200 RepID=A0ABZ0I2F1_9GAMM|nr:RAMP superfamily CRISPR-associated protein [Congregibacter sp. IMCC43200]